MDWSKCHHMLEQNHQPCLPCASTQQGTIIQRFFWISKSSSKLFLSINAIKDVDFEDDFWIFFTQSDPKNHTWHNLKVIFDRPMEKLYYSISEVWQLASSSYPINISNSVANNENTKFKRWSSHAINVHPHDVVKLTQHPLRIRNEETLPHFRPFKKAVL
jgi:hypothetical protein